VRLCEEDRLCNWWEWDCGGGAVVGAKGPFGRSLVERGGK